jgi:hypothetical protein
MLKRCFPSLHSSTLHANAKAIDNFRLLLCHVQNSHLSNSTLNHYLSTCHRPQGRTTTLLSVTNGYALLNDTSCLSFLRMTKHIYRICTADRFKVLHPMTVKTLVTTSKYYSDREREKKGRISRGKQRERLTFKKT